MNDNLDDKVSQAHSLSYLRGSERSPVGKLNASDSLSYLRGSEQQKKKATPPKVFSKLPTRQWTTTLLSTFNEQISKLPTRQWTFAGR